MKFLKLGLIIALFAIMTGTVGAQTVAYYVSPTGSDSNPGTLNAPLATIQKAESLVIKNYLGTNCSAQTQPIIVQFLGGLWQNVALKWTSSDSGCNAKVPVIFENYPGSTPQFAGGFQVTNWTTNDGITWQAALPSTTVNFEMLYYNGARRLRPRLTSTGNIEGDQYRIAGNVTGDYDRFIYSSTAPISTDWQNYSPSPNNPCGQAPGPASTQGDIEVIVFEQWDTSVERISCIDPVTQTVYLTGKTASGPFHGYLLNHRYVIENVRDSLVLPGQWFLDRSVTPWVLNYIANPGENPNTDVVIVPQNLTIVNASNISNRQFYGITFCCDNYVVPSTGYAGEQAEILSGQGLICNDCNNVTFDSNTFEVMSGYGLSFPTDNHGTATGDVIQNNLFYDLASGGILTGRSVTGPETDANVIQHATIRNNLIQGYGRKFAGAAGIIHLLGHDILTTNNDITDGYNQGIMLCFPNANLVCKGRVNSGGEFNMTTSYNHIWNLGQGILNDFGGIYMSTYTATGNVNKGNKIHDISDASTQDADGYGGNGFYIDRGGPITISNNLVYRVVNALNMTTGPQLPGQTISASNNIFAYARNAVFMMFDCDPAGVQQFNLSTNIVQVDRTVTSVPAFSIQKLSAYLGSPVGSAQMYRSNDYWNTAETLGTDSRAFYSEPSSCAGRSYLSFANWQKQGEDAGGMVASPGFKNPVYPTDDFSFVAGPPHTGFVLFCTSGQGTACPGRTSGAVIPAITPGFTTKPFNPSTDY
jgi:hypothetical protein